MTKDKFDRKWITDNSLEEIENYEKGELTIRGLHYRLVSRGMTNSFQHYKRVVSAMIKLRKEGDVPYDTFSDHDRGMECYTASTKTDVYSEIDHAKGQIKAWMNNYSKDRWENQDYYPEVWIEKKALIGAFEKVCVNNEVALCACKGYPSLTFLDDAVERFKEATYDDKTPIILYFGDYDASGEDIPRSIKENLIEMGVHVEVKRVLLMENQVLEYNLPPAPSKVTDSRTANWDGMGQVELDALEPSIIKEVLQESIDDIFDTDLHEELIETEIEEREKFQTELKQYVQAI